MFTLVLIRHGESTWNLENRFTGWTDVDLSSTGLAEAATGGELLAKEGLDFDICYTSVLKRAIRTLDIVLDVMDRMWLPVVKSWRLNERHYGALQGLNKREMTEKYGEEQVFAWRRSYDTRPPALEMADERHPRFAPCYRELDGSLLPASECLKDTVARVVPFWNETISPMVRSGRRVLIAAHGNSLRALVKHLDEIADDEISQLNIPTGVPLIYELREDLTPIRSRYLGDPDEVAKKIGAVANQAKTAKPS